MSAQCQVLALHLTVDTKHNLPQKGTMTNSSSGQAKDSTNQAEHTFREFRELDVWTSSLALWEKIWPHAIIIPEEDSPIANRLRTAILGMPVLLAKAHKIKYWDSNRQSSYLKTALEYLAEIDVMYALAVELEHLEPSEELETIMEDITKMTAGMLKKSQLGYQRQSESSADDSN